MTDIELLFMEYRRKELISFEEFQHRGWNTEEYLTYLYICEEIRAILICLHRIHHKVIVNSNDIPKWKNDLFYSTIKHLSEWLSQYFDNPLNLHWSPAVLEPFITYGIDPAYERDELKRYCCLIFTSSDDFRYQIERLITIVVLKDYGQIAGDDISKLPVEYLQKHCAKLKTKLLHNIEPPFPENLNSYTKIQEWASAYESYSINEESYEDSIEAIENEINQRFIPSRDTLYVYSGNPGCLANHETISVTAVIPGFDAKSHELNVNYCVECGRFFIKLSEYERYQEKYHFMLARVERIDSTLETGFYNRKEYSPLMLCGYTVSIDAGLTERNRRALLSKLLDTHVFSKEEIITHLDMLININGEQANMKEARRKWLSDLDFVRDYRINEQDKALIIDVKPASKNLRKV